MPADDTLPRSRRRWPFAVRLAAYLLWIAFLLAAGEVVLRRYAPEVSDTFVVQLKDAACRYHHEPFFRDPEPVPDPDAYRILFLGDSYTWGICDPWDTYPRLVGKELRIGAASGCGPIQAQTVNLASVSYSPSIEGVILRDFAPIVRPHLVVIAIDDSDPQDDWLYRDLVVKDRDGLPLSVYPGLRGVPDWLLPLARRLKLVRLTCALLNRLAGPLDPEQGDREFKAFGSANQRYNHLFPGKRKAWRPLIDRTISFVDTMVRYCRDRGIGVALVNYPLPPTVTTRHCQEWRRRFGLGRDRLYDSPLHAATRSYAQSHGVPYYNFTTYLSSLPDLEGFYWEEDGHFTRKGNVHLARELVRFLCPIIAASGVPLRKLPPPPYSPSLHPAAPRVLDVTVSGSEMANSSVAAPLDGDVERGNADEPDGYWYPGNDVDPSGDFTYSVRFDPVSITRIDLLVWGNPPSYGYRHTPRRYSLDVHLSGEQRWVGWAENEIVDDVPSAGSLREVPVGRWWITHAGRRRVIDGIRWRVHKTGSDCGPVLCELAVHDGDRRIYFQPYDG